MATDPAPVVAIRRHATASTCSINVLNFLFADPTFQLITLNRQIGLPAPDDDYRRFYRQRDFAAFIPGQLSQLTRRLTLNQGLRYEYFDVQVSRRDTLDLPTTCLGTGRTSASASPTASSKPDRYSTPIEIMLPPASAIALDLFGNIKSVLRGGYGLFYDRVFNDLWLDVRSHPPLHPDRQAFPRVLIQQGQQPQRSPLVRSGTHEVVAPHVVRSLRPQSYTGTVVQPQPSSRPLFLRHFQPFPLAKSAAPGPCPLPSPHSAATL